MSKKINLIVAIYLLGITVLILWNVLSSGFVFSLDMVMGPYAVIEKRFLNMAPVSFLWDLRIPPWLIQKFIMIEIFFVSGLLAYFFCDAKQTVSKIVVALFYVLNPFVFSRFISGQWGILVAYSFLPLLFWLIKRNISIQGEIKTAVILYLIGVFSSHMFFFCLIVYLCFKFFKIVEGEKKYNFLALSISILIIAVLNGYWIYGLLTNSGVRFDANHLEPFASKNFWQALLLNNFWLKTSAWGSQVRWPDQGLAFYIGYFLLFVTLFSSLVIKSKDKLKAYLFAYSITVLLSCGFLGSILKFFESNLAFGLRDVGKINAFGVLFLSSAIGLAIDRIASLNFRKKFCLFFCFTMIPFLIGFNLFFGFGGQLHNYDYPESFREVKQLVGDKKVLFLPWHGYMTFDFAGSSVISNPSGVYFGPGNLYSKSVEYGGIVEQETDNRYLKISNIIRRGDVKQVREMLIDEGVDYIAFYKSQNEKVPTCLDLQNSFEKVYESNEIELYFLINR